MANHHGDDLTGLPSNLEELLRQKSTFGATGAYPQGRLNENDEGELQFGITNSKGSVLINFGKPVAWLGMDPNQAIVFANGIIRHANQARIINSKLAEVRVMAAQHKVGAD